MSNRNLNENQIIIVTGFALFLLGIIANAVFTLKFDEINVNVIFYVKSFLLFAVVSLILSILFGAMLFLQDPGYNWKKIENSLIYILGLAVASVMAVLVVIIMESSIYSLIIFVCLIIALLYVERYFRVG